MRFFWSSWWSDTTSFNILSWERPSLSLSDARTSFTLMISSVSTCSYALPVSASSLPFAKVTLSIHTILRISVAPTVCEWYCTVMKRKEDSFYNVRFLDESCAAFLALDGTKIWCLFVLKSSSNQNIERWSMCWLNIWTNYFRSIWETFFIWVDSQRSSVITFNFTVARLGLQLPSAHATSQVRPSDVFTNDEAEGGYLYNAMRFCVVTVCEWSRKMVSVRLVLFDTVSQWYKQRIVEPFHLPVWLWLQLATALYILAAI